MFTKISILLEYLRVCVSIPVRNACYAVMALVIAYGVQTFFSGLFTCTPVAAFWDQTIPGKCVDRWALFFANGGINIFIDFTILLLPVFLLRSLMIPKRQKYILMGILALGGL